MDFKVFYQGEIQFWIDGKKLIQWSDPQFFPDGKWGLAHDLLKADACAIYDNFAVCGLQVPFVSILTNKGIRSSVRCAKK
jgi:hypothetical protein